MNDLTVFAFGNVDALHGIFNALAMIFGSADFGGMVRLATLIGFATLLSHAAFGNLQKSWQWFIGVVVISTVMITPRSTVTIEDRLGAQAPVVVSNVPWALALLASVKTSMGWALTQVTETAFQTIPSLERTLPTELSYTNHGVMFGSTLVSASRQLELSSVPPRVRIVVASIDQPRGRG